jgi:hypothetical protein
MKDPINNPEEFVDRHAYFAYVVDGEVTHLHTVDFLMELVIASMSSNPTVVRLSKEDALKVKGGWYFDGNEFKEKL